MTTNEPPRLDEPGLAGGPGPTPPGVDDRTPKPNAGPGAPPPAPPQDAEAQQEEGEAAERSAGTRQADVAQAARRGREMPGAARDDPEEPDAS